MGRLHELIQSSRKIKREEFLPVTVRLPKEQLAVIDEMAGQFGRSRQEMLC
ncbi:ribbon-helix-helix protein, CopG family [Variovorax gossypii]